MEKAIEIPENFGPRCNNFTTGDIVNVVLPVFTGSYRSPRFEHYELFYNCKIVKDEYDRNGKHWLYFKNDEMIKAKKMQGKNFYENARIIEISSDKDELTAIKVLKKEQIAIEIGEKKF